MLTEERIQQLASRRGVNSQVLLGWLYRMQDEDNTRGQEFANLEEDVRRHPDWHHNTVAAIQTGILEHFQEEKEQI